MSTAARCAEAGLDPRTPPHRRLTDAEALAGLGVTALLVSCVLSPRGIEDGPVLCPFRLATGLPCPGCGLTRSWVYLTHGWWRESLLAHPFGALTAAFVVGLAVLVVRARLTGRVGPRLDDVVRRRLTRVVLLAWLGFAVVRLVLTA